MKCAEVMVETTNYSLRGCFHFLAFASVEAATEQYHLLNDLLSRREDRKNDVPRTFEVQAGDGLITLVTEDIRSVRLCILEKADELSAGNVEAYPNLFAKPVSPPASLTTNGEG